MTFGLTQILDAVLGRGESAITIPALDGALRPNRRLDEAERIAVERPSGLLAGADGLLVATADEIRRLNGDGSWTLFHKAGSPIACMGSAGGGIALGLESG